MKVKNLKQIVNEIPRSQDDLDVYVYENCGNCGYARPLERAYIGKTYTKDKGCRMTLQLQFNCSDSVINKGNFKYHIDQMIKAERGEDYYLKDTNPIPHFTDVVEALEYLYEHVND